MPSLPRSRTTLAAGALILCLAGVYAVDALWGASGVSRGEFVAIGIPVENAGLFDGVLRGIVVVVALLYVRMGVGVLQRRPAVREGALLVTAALGVLAALFAIAGVTAQPPTPNAPAAAATAVANVAAAALLWHPRTRDDTDRAERARGRRDPRRS